jgi:hypothetical protein
MPALMCITVNKSTITIKINTSMIRAKILILVADFQHIPSLAACQADQVGILMHAS